MKKVISIVWCIVSLNIPLFGFEGFSNDPGSHMASLSQALQKTYVAKAGNTALKFTMPVWGLKTYTWDHYYAADLMADASRDIDSFYFGPLYPHAQTPSFSYTKALSPRELRSIEAKALLDYLQFMDGWFIRLRSLFASAQSDVKKERDALYLLGVIIHSYQDLWAHYGITNEMHRALLKHRGIDVDRDPKRIAIMEHKLEGFVTNLPGLLGTPAGEIFVSLIKSDQEYVPPTIGERKKLLGRGRDIFLEGINYVVFTSDTDKSLTYLEQIQWDAETLDKIVQNPEALHQAASQKSPDALISFLEIWGYQF
ncbi:hypothetical protein [Gracilinema caldarium]|uniref:hypothetical protein n=1 Tax=Gracilinema caldarium TaxID=215591 RepID=UPI0026EE6B59|nr:hypothetical protein [Gracilinema caldarium]